MTIVSIFSSSYCNGEDVARGLAHELGYRHIDDDHLLAQVAAERSIPIERLVDTLRGGLWGSRSKHLAYLRLAVAEAVMDGNAVLHGFSGHLLHKGLPETFKTIVSADRDYRVLTAMRMNDVGEARARESVIGDDMADVQWAQHLFDLGPWDERLYDRVIARESTSVEEAVRALAELVRQRAKEQSGNGEKKAVDFLLAARVHAFLAERSYDVEVTSLDGCVTIVSRKRWTQLERLEAQEENLARTIAGLRSIQIRAADSTKTPDTAEPPVRLLIADDERDFTHTLARRLEARGFSTAVAYDGEDALMYMDTKEPSAMVLDLKLHDIDGIEVLRRTRKNHPDVPVVILTGHGSDIEEALVLELGAFAYLHKPTDIELMVRAIRIACYKASQAKQRRYQTGFAPN